MPDLLRIQGLSIVDDPVLMEAVAPYLMECNCAQVLTILPENSFQIAKKTKISNW
ncbi:hypothetical protein MUP29_03375 [bacterium]|nr:hypothetical protein [bacterium]